MKRWFITLLSAGLVVLLAALFTLSCALNRKQYLANLQFIRADMYETLSREVSSLREHILARDREMFALFGRPDLSFDTCLANRLFILKGGKAFPAGLPDVLPQDYPDPETGRKAMALGREMLGNRRFEKARECFQAADHVVAANQADLQIRITAALELLRLAEYRDARTLFNILYSLFDYPNLTPDPQTLQSAETELRTNIKDYGELKEQSRALWQTAAMLSAAITNHAAPFRLYIDGSFLSVNLAGQAFLSPLPPANGKETATLMKIGTTAPGDRAAVVREMRTVPVFAWIPTEHFQLRKQSVEHAYRLTNIMLGLLLAVIAVMGVGIGLILKRQHEVTALRSSFISSVSHELRTPLALIRLYAESLSASSQSPDSRDKYTRAIISETDRLSALANNVLDFSKIEKNTITLNPKTTDLSSLTMDVLDSFAVRLEKEKIELVRRITPRLSATVDPMAMTQVIFNLLDNAVKYSGDAKRIEVEMASTGRNILLHIRDRGIGIPDPLKTRIFDPFVRGDDSRVTAQRGSGIGLTIVRELLNRMHCSIRVLDNSPAGTVFEVTIPSEQKEVPK